MSSKGTRRQGKSHVSSLFPTKLPAALVFKIKTLPQKQYVRFCDDLIFTACISLEDALCVKPIVLETLDGRIIKVSIDQIITPKTVKIVPNEGMPIFNPFDEADLEQVVRGNLQIRFKIGFPGALTIE
jgi:DnaJ family protein B protein 4